jgi:hypothetical protein
MQEIGIEAIRGRAGERVRTPVVIRTLSEMLGGNVVLKAENCNAPA